MHPTAWVRNALNIAVLRRLGDGHPALAAEIDARFRALRPGETHITWRLGRALDVARIPVAEMETAADIVAELLVNHKFASLAGQSYADLADFTANDQAIVEESTAKLVAADPTFAREGGSTPRHALAAAMLAFERDRAQAVRINETFRHFL